MELAGEATSIHILGIFFPGVGLHICVFPGVENEIWMWSERYSGSNFSFSGNVAAMAAVFNTKEEWDEFRCGRMARAAVKTKVYCFFGGGFLLIFM